MVLANIWGVVTIIVAWVPDELRRSRRLGNICAWATAIVVVALFVVWAVVNLTQGNNYGTDAIGFNQYAAELMRSGHNPYVHSMAPAYQLFDIPTFVYTYSLSGVPVTALSYPSLSFLVYVPFLLAGWSHNLAPVLNIAAWALTILIMFALLPRLARPLVLVVGGYGIYAAFALGSVTDVLYMPLLVITAYRWDKFGDGWKTYLAPVALGLAMGIKQTPWLVLPFMLIALALDEEAERGWRASIARVGRYLAAVAVTFFATNLPWIIASPREWIKGALTPIVANVVPTGQGLIALSMYLRHGAGSIALFSAAMAFGMLLLLVLFISTYPLLRRPMFLLPGLAFLFGARSNANYFVCLIPAGIVAAVTARDVAGRGLRWRQRSGIVRATSDSDAWPELVFERTWPSRLQVWFGFYFRSPRWGLATVACAALFLASTVAAVAYPSRLRLSIASVRTTGSTNQVDEITVRATNTADSAANPAFSLLNEGFGTTFWNVRAGPASLAPHTTATYRLIAPNASSMPSAAGGFNVIAYVDHPGALAVSPTYVNQIQTLRFIPLNMNHPVRVGRPVKVQVEMYSRSGDPVAKDGVAIRLWATVRTPTGALGSHVRINGGEPGRAAIAYTNKRGVAAFEIVGTRALDAPATFSAATVRGGSHLYGSHDVLDVWFVEH